MTCGSAADDGQTVFQFLFINLYAIVNKYEMKYVIKFKKPKEENKIEDTKDDEEERRRIRSARICSTRQGDKWRDEKPKRSERQNVEEAGEG